MSSERQYLDGKITGDLGQSTWGWGSRVEWNGVEKVNGDRGGEHRYTDCPRSLPLNGNEDTELAEGVSGSRESFVFPELC